MRKRNAVLSWVAKILILLLCFLLFASYALLWGRLFAPIMPDSPLTLLWKAMRDCPIVKLFMNWLRHLSFYAACCQAARNADGSMEPLKYVLEVMGCVSFALGAVSEIKATRSFGMLMHL